MCTVCSVCQWVPDAVEHVRAHRCHVSVLLHSCAASRNSFAPVSLHFCADSDNDPVPLLQHPCATALAHLYSSGCILGHHPLHVCATPTLALSNAPLLPYARYHVYRVNGAGSSQAMLGVLVNPDRLWSEGHVQMQMITALGPAGAPQTPIPSM